MRKLYILTLLLLLLLPFIANAQEVEIDGINYTLIPKGKVAEVIAKSSGKYEGDITIPSTVTYEETVYNVTGIGDEAFQYCSNLTSITIPNCVTSIGNNAFRYCSTSFTKVIISDLASWCNISFSNMDSNPLIYAHHLFLNDSEIKDIIIPNSVMSIGNFAFSYCSNLTSITIPNSVASIGQSAFVGCSGLTSITIPNSVTSIGSSAFSYCSSLTTITIPNSVTSIDNYAFSGCSSLTSITIPNNVTSIGYYAFSDCSSLTSIEIPNSVASIGGSAFERCSGLTSITIPNNVTSIGYSAFKGCSGLTSIEIPNSVTSIDRYAFSGCSSLTSITIGKSVKYIDEKAFEKCKNLTDVTCLAIDVPQTTDGKNPQEDAKIFNESYIEYATLHVPEGSVAAYKAKAPWSGFKSIVSVVETKYTLTYQLDGEEYKTYQLAEGDPITPEPAPTKEGYTFSGWSTIPATMPAENLTITGKFEKITSEDVINLTEKGEGQSTWCSKYDLNFKGVEGIKAYIASGYNVETGLIMLTRIYDVPAGTGIMLIGNPGDYKIPHTVSKTYYSNMFVGVLEATTVPETSGDYVNYYLSAGTQGVGFYRVSGSVSLKANRAYLPARKTLPGSASTRGFIGFEFSDGTTALDSAPAATPATAPAVYYNLQGQRVDKPTKGLYIKNGKKVVIK